jgi:hypothetical protein
MGTFEDHQSLYLVPQSSKKPNIHMGSVGRNLQAQLKIIKNYRNTISTNQNEILS